MNWKSIICPRGVDFFPVTRWVTLGERPCTNHDHDAAGREGILSPTHDIVMPVCTLLTAALRLSERLPPNMFAIDNPVCVFYQYLWIRLVFFHQYLCNPVLWILPISLQSRYLQCYLTSIFAIPFVFFTDIFAVPFVFLLLLDWLEWETTTQYVCYRWD